MTLPPPAQCLSRRSRAWSWSRSAPACSPPARVASPSSRRRARSCGRSRRSFHASTARLVAPRVVGIRARRRLEPSLTAAYTALYGFGERRRRSSRTRCSMKDDLFALLLSVFAVGYVSRRSARRDVRPRVASAPRTPAAPPPRTTTPRRDTAWTTSGRPRVFVDLNGDGERDHSCVLVRAGDSRLRPDRREHPDARPPPTARWCCCSTSSPATPPSRKVIIILLSLLSRLLRSRAHFHPWRLVPENVRVSAPSAARSRSPPVISSPRDAELHVVPIGAWMVAVGRYRRMARPLFNHSFRLMWERTLQNLSRGTRASARWR